MKKYLILPLIFLFFGCSLIAQPKKIAILPFSNLDGNYDYNKYCYELSDSLTKAFSELDPDGKYIQVLSIDEVNDVLSDQNIDANSPSFDGDKWNVITELKVDRIISGNFRIAGNRFVINSYIYYPDTQLSDPDFQAKGVFKKEDKIMESVPVIVKQLSKAFMPE